MGSVVHFAPAQAKAGQRRRRRRSKTALVLGGGGFTGGVYEIGALRALDLLSVNRTVNQFDVYVGTSAGAFVAAMAANGITPEEMMRVVNNQVPTPFRDLTLGTALQPNVLPFVRAGLTLPWRLAKLGTTLLRDVGAISALDVVLGLAEGMPSGLYNGGGLEAYVRTVLSDPDRSDDFRDLDAELYLAATDLDTCERVVLGTEGESDVPISRAVRASTALPMVYSPVRVKGRELVDGGIVSTTNLDIAVEAGATFVVVVNPLVPYVNDLSQTSGGRRRHISDLGFTHIGYQAFKLLAYQRLHEMARSWTDRYPGVDILLIEPEPDDELMFRTSIMSYANRTEIARHGFESVTVKLASDYDRLKAIAGRHGITLSAERLQAVLDEAERQGEGGTSAWRRILEQTTSTLLRQGGGPS